jgi:hypothetical protein
VRNGAGGETGESLLRVRRDLGGRGERDAGIIVHAG